MSVRRPLALAAAASALAFSAVVLPAASASAAPEACGSGKACMYRNPSYGGGYFNFYEFIENLSGHTYSPVGWWSANDSVSSVFNNGNFKPVRFYQHKNYGGAYVDLPIKREDSHLGDRAGTIAKMFDNRISSAKFLK